MDVAINSSISVEKVGAFGEIGSVGKEVGSEKIGGRGVGAKEVSSSGSSAGSVYEGEILKSRRSIQ